MPRAARIVLPGLPHHKTQRGNYRQKTFFRAEDYRLYLDLLGEYSRHFGVSILAYCSMPNHVRLIATPHDTKALGRLFQRVHSDYARAVHLRLRRTGHLWQARYHSVPLDEEHFWASMVYVEQNPLRAGLVGDPVQWRWSSASAHLSGVKCPFLDLVAWREQHTPESWKRCLDLGLHDAALFERIREGTLTGRPIGSEGFLKRLELEFAVEARQNSQVDKHFSSKWLHLNGLGRFREAIFSLTDRVLRSLTPLGLTPLGLEFCRLIVYR